MIIYSLGAVGKRFDISPTRGVHGEVGKGGEINSEIGRKNQYKYHTSFSIGQMFENYNQGGGRLVKWLTTAPRCASVHRVSI